MIILPGLPDKLRWVNAIGELPPVEGCIYSNELVDNFSVHRVVMEQELMELFVDCRDGAFTNQAHFLRGLGNDLLGSRGTQLQLSGFRITVPLPAPAP